MLQADIDEADAVAIANNITVSGSAQSRGRAQLTLGDTSLYRIDAVQSGPVGENIYFAVGGFLRQHEEYAVDLVIERQAVLLKDQIATIGRNAADAGDVLHFTTGRFHLDTRNGAEQVGEILGRDPLDFLLPRRIHRIGHVEPTLGAGASRSDDICVRFLFLRAVLRAGASACAGACATAVSGIHHVNAPSEVSSLAA